MLTSSFGKQSGKLGKAKRSWQRSFASWTKSLTSAPCKTRNVIWARWCLAKRFPRFFGRQLGWQKAQILTFQLWSVSLKVGEASSGSLYASTRLKVNLWTQSLKGNFLPKRFLQAFQASRSGSPRSCLQAHAFSRTLTQWRTLKRACGKVFFWLPKAVNGFQHRSWRRWFFCFSFV